MYVHCMYVSFFCLISCIKTQTVIKEIMLSPFLQIWRKKVAKSRPVVASTVTSRTRPSVAPSDTPSAWNSCFATRSARKSSAKKSIKKRKLFLLLQPIKQVSFLVLLDLWIRSIITQEYVLKPKGDSALGDSASPLSWPSASINII